MPVLSQSPSPSRWKHPGTPVTAHLQGTWFSAPNHCLTRFHCSHSCATLSFALAFTATVHPPTQCLGLLGCYKGMSPQPAPAKSCTPESWPAMHPGPPVQSAQLQPVLFSLLISLQQTHVRYSPSSELCEIYTLNKLLYLSAREMGVNGK